MQSMSHPLYMVYSQDFPGKTKHRVYSLQGLEEVIFPNGWSPALRPWYIAPSHNVTYLARGAARNVTCTTFKMSCPRATGRDGNLCSYTPLLHHL